MSEPNLEEPDEEEIEVDEHFPEPKDEEEIGQYYTPETKERD